MLIVLVEKKYKKKQMVQVAGNFVSFRMVRFYLRRGAMVGQSKEVVLDTLDPRRIGTNRVMVFIGKRGAGKTFLMEDICYFYARTIPVAVIWSETEEGNETWGRHFPDYFIHTSYDAQRLQLIYNRQFRMARRRRREADAGVPEAKRTRVTPILLILEDQSFRKSIFHCPVLAKVIMNGRHYGITMMITTQYSRSITREMRSQFDYVFCCIEKFFQLRKSLHEDYFGVFEKFETFNQVMMQCTRDFGCLVLDNVSRSCDVRDSVFFYKAKDRGPYKFGSRAYWLFHFMHYKQNYDDDDDEDVDYANLGMTTVRGTVSTRVRAPRAPRSRNPR